jgi:uncharacterized membrane protein YidH (DUF202 family)
MIDNILEMFKIFDLLYYANYVLGTRSKNFTSKEAGMWYTDMLEICFFVGVLFFILGIFSIDIRGTYKEAKEFYLVIALVIMSGLYKFLGKYHTSRHEEIIKKYAHITNVWICLLISLSYCVAIIAFDIFIGMFYSNSVTP